MVKHIDRMSKFLDLSNISSNEYERARLVIDIFEQCRELFGGDKRGIYFGPKRGEVSNGKNLIMSLYYRIGMIDYYMAYNDETLNRNEIIDLLEKRAIFSAVLQYFKDDFIENTQVEHARKALTFPREKIEISFKDIPDKLYHGTKSRNVTIENLGKPDEKGKYYTKDGMIYMADIDTARRYSSGENSQLIEICMNKSDIDQYFVIYESNGHVPFMFQEEIYDMSKNGKVKWLIQSPKISGCEVLDISNFANFVDWRDARICKSLKRNNVRLPNGIECYMEYIDYLEQERLGRSVTNPIEASSPER